MSDQVTVIDPGGALSVTEQPGTIAVVDASGAIAVTEDADVVTVIDQGSDTVSVTEVPETITVSETEGPITVIEVGSIGPQGPTGPAGPAGSTYLHTQAVPSDVWTINHGLGFYPNVSVEDTLGRDVEGETSWPTINQVVLNFSAAFSGRAFLS